MNFFIRPVDTIDWPAVAVVFNHYTVHSLFELIALKKSVLFRWHRLR